MRIEYQKAGHKRIPWDNVFKNGNVKEVRAGEKLTDLPS
jgi:hypothetical protein